MGDEVVVLDKVIEISVCYTFAILAIIVYIVQYLLYFIQLGFLIHVAINPPGDYSKMILAPMTLGIVIGFIMRFCFNIGAIGFVVYLRIAQLVNFLFEKNKLRTVVPIILQFCWFLIGMLLFTYEICMYILAMWAWEEFLHYWEGVVITALLAALVISTIVLYILAIVGLAVKYMLSPTGRAIISYIAVNIIYAGFKWVGEHSCCYHKSE
jgi:hypothetical protein